jgi:hypothetical protein
MDVIGVTAWDISHFRVAQLTPGVLDTQVDRRDLGKDLTVA